MSERTDTIAIIVAAGSGSRAGEGAPKQYRLLDGKPLLRHSVERFIAHPGIDAVLVVIDPAVREHYESATDGLHLLPPVHGGASRQESVHNGLEAIASLRPKRVLVHDAARPFVSEVLISRVLDGLAHAPGCVPVIPVTDTIKQRSGDYVVHTLPRASLAAVQTPQGFDYTLLATLHRDTPPGATDDAMILEHAGKQVRLVPGDIANEKLTYQEDFPMDTVTGHGIDVHGFADHIYGEEAACWLGGVKIQHARPLAGHSDADVVLHALTDALLGAIGAGDIGQHFPPSDPQWENAPSEKFLKHAMQLLAAQEGRLVHVDVTIIGEAPRISPHRTAIRANVARILGLPETRVSIKATTTEKLGFLGREEGLAAMATATVQLP